MDHKNLFNFGDSKDTKSLFNSSNSLTELINRNPYKPPEPKPFTFEMPKTTSRSTYKPAQPDIKPMCPRCGGTGYIYTPAGIPGMRMGAPIRCGCR